MNSKGSSGIVKDMQQDTEKSHDRKISILLGRLITYPISMGSSYFMPTVRFSIS